MDPFSAVSLTGTVLTFTEFTVSIISKSKELYTAQHGALAQNLELEEATDRLVALTKNLETASQQQGSGLQGKSTAVHAQSLKAILRSCLGVAKELVEVLDKLKVPKGQKWTSVYRALRSVWKKDKIKDLSRRISKYRKEIAVHLLAMIR